jgi:5-methyltetrahydropteroyltriglutamate--homocysteine methyltransferase
VSTGSIHTVHRAQTVGSLVRPAWLKEARATFAAGDLTTRQFKKIEDRAVDESIKVQLDAGIELVNDGEQRRSTYAIGPIASLRGFAEVTDAAPGEWYHLDGTVDVVTDTMIAVEPLTRARSMFTEEATYLRSHTDAAIKCTIPSPMCAMYAWDPERSKDAYPTPLALIADLARLLRDDVRELVDLGVDYIQVDAPEFTIAVDDRRRKEWFDLGFDPDELVSESIRLVNEMFDGVDGCRVGLHLCRGNWDGRYMAEGGYDAIATALFTQAPAIDEYLLEYDDERAGGFEVLREVPADKHVSLGLVSTKVNAVESDEEVRARISEASTFLDLDQLGLCTQCGFSPGVTSTMITPDVQRGKLELLSRVAGQVWG